MSRVGFPIPGGMQRGTGVGWSYGTFGELLQGVLPGQRHVLVTLPVALYTRSTFTPLPGSGVVSVYPRHKQKARQLAERLLGHLGLPTGGLLTIQSEIPEGKGCASSSADMVAAARAVADAAGREVSPAELGALLATLEPTDGVMYDGVVSFYSREGRLRRHLGPMPPLTIAGLDEGGWVDTVAFHRQTHRLTPVEKLEYAQLLTEMEAAFAAGNLVAVGAAATRSAIMNQRRLPKAHLPLFLHLYRRHQTAGALGVVVAHTGTCIGLLLDPGHPGYRETLHRVWTRLQRLSQPPALYQTPLR